MFRYYFRKNIYFPLLRAIRGGISPHTFALSAGVAFIVGIIPMYFVTPFITGLIVLRLRLSMLIAQVVNIIVAPLQALLIVPFYRIGYKFLPGKSDYFEVSSFCQMLREDFFHCLSLFWKSVCMAIAVWFIASIPIGMAVYFITRGVFKNIVLLRQVKL